MARQVGEASGWPGGGTEFRRKVNPRAPGAATARLGSRSLTDASVWTEGDVSAFPLVAPAD
jgi:hypothetical protein